MKRRVRARVEDRPGVMDRKFKPVFGRRVLADMRVVHPVTVLLDLKQGSLRSLARYLRQTKGVMDRQVAVELQKMLSAGAPRTNFKLAAIAHPKVPRSKGGRPRGKRPTSAQEELIYNEYQTAIAQGDKPTIARENLARRFQCSAATVRRVVQKVSLVR